MKQKPSAMVPPTVTGVWGLVLAVVGGNPTIRVLGAVLFGLGVVYWVVFGFIVDPGRDGRSRS